MSDRILIMRRGSISGHFHRDQQPTEEQLIQYMV
jgi:ABC-type sugar transport system ATPase subunit